MKGPEVFRLEGRGLERVLGPLEARIMEVLWAAEGPLPVEEVCRRLGGAHHKTVLTVLSRLVHKGLVERSSRGRAYLFSPREGREAFLARVADRVIQGLLEGWGPLAVARFLSALESLSPEDWARLKALLQGEEGPHAG